MVSSTLIYGNFPLKRSEKIKLYRALKQAQSFSKQVDQFISNIKNAKSNKKILNKNCLFISLCLIDLYHRHHIISFNFEKVYLYVKDYLVYHKIEFLLENQEFMTIMK